MVVILSVVVGLIHLLEHLVVVEHRIVLDHGSLRLEVGTSVILVAHSRRVGHVACKKVANDEAGTEGVSVEELAGHAVGMTIGPLLDQALIRNDTDATLISHGSLADEASNGPGESGSEDEPLGVLDTVFNLELDHVLVDDSLGAGHVLARSHRDPLVIREIILEPE